ncbi:unnamed protein product [Polarella glacialis]|nr:unnamed protein product [Polarella glacialis]
MKAASKVLSTPVEIGSLRLSVAVLMTALCGALSLLSYSGLRRSEMRAEQVSSSSLAQTMILGDQQMRNVFHQGRNLYLSLLGFTVWVVAWRLKVLHDNQQLAPPKARGRGQTSPTSRIMWALAGLLALLLSDVPLCRLNYQLQLAAFVTPRKERLMASAGMCDNVLASTAVGQCQVFCEDVRLLSEERMRSIMWVRSWHLLGRIAAEVFDDARDVAQGPERIEKLFAQKSCAQVLRSVDKSNQLVNAACAAAAGVSIIAAFAALAHVFAEEDQLAPSGNHQD